ncbi:hypothetical protein COF80_22695 [Bacillus toyonensis]|uniref:hypothetical protein n=1 Tax=Bacillus toyonensis TaxID=155322 RepID=UPI000BFC7710|nr:hypothetical protein [Bacillus toyonensis]PHE83687.1 hypothetical protein COF80_22695 [Bacillus toyonensis]
MDNITEEIETTLKEIRSSFNKLKRYKIIKESFEKFVELRNSALEQNLRELLANSNSDNLTKETGLSAKQYIQKEIKPFDFNSLEKEIGVINDFIAHHFNHHDIRQQLNKMARASVKFTTESLEFIIQTRERADSITDHAKKIEVLENYKDPFNQLKKQYELDSSKNTLSLIEITIKEFKNDKNIFHINSNTNTEKKELQKAIDETMLKVTQTAGLSDFLYAIPSVTKHGYIDGYDTSKQVYVNEDKDIEFTISIPEAFKKNPTLTENHVKLFLFSLHKHCTGDKKRTLIPYKEFFHFKGLEDTKDNRKKLKKEIEELECVEFDYKYKEKGAKEWTKVSKARAISYLDTRPGSGISVAFGTWAEYIPSTFIDINKAVFKYPVTRNSIGATTISFKLRELSSMNKKSVRVRILTDLLDISEKVINKHGFSWVKDKIERELERIEEAEKLQWQYRNGIHNSRIDFENDYIEFHYS